MAAIFVLLSGCSRSAEHYLQQGNEFSAAGKLADASLNYRRAIQENPKLSEAFYKLGLTEYKLQNFHTAFDALSRAVQRSPAREDYKVAFGDLCLTGYIASPSRPQNLYRAISKISDELLSKDANSFRASV